jgi:hypothetical protein
VPSSQGQRGEGLTRHRTNVVDSEDIEDIPVGEFEFDEPENILEKVRASKGSATPGGMRAPPRVVDRSASLACSMARNTGQVWVISSMMVKAN